MAASVGSSASSGLSKPRRGGRLLIGGVAIAAAGAVLIPSAGAAGSEGSSGAARTPSPAPIAHPGPAQVRAAVAALPGQVRRMMSDTGVPGVAVGVVYRDKLIYSQGFGVRDTEMGGRVNPRTVFQLASMSKPLGASAVAAAVGEGVLDWDDPVSRYIPGFTLSDPWIGSHVTVGDLYSHRSGLPGQAGNELEYYGFDRDTIIERLRFAPLNAWRTSYSYSNFGLTTAGQAAANAAGMSWQRLAATKVLDPLGMRRSSFDHKVFARQSNTAALHQVVHGEWVPAVVRDAQNQSPAGGASSCVVDLARWVRMELGNGRFEGRRIVKKRSLAKARTVQVRNSADNTPAVPVKGYGYGMDVSVDTTGRVRWAHSGAFSSGAATRVSLIPDLDLGIIVLSNGWPIGVVEALTETFGDLVEYGSPQQDWLAFFKPLLGQYTEPTYAVDGSRKPTNPTPPRDLAAFTGTYRNDFVGTATVNRVGNHLVLRVGPNGRTKLRLRHWDADTFVFPSIDMPAGFPSPVTFSGSGPGGGATTMDIREVTSGLGVMSRSAP